MFLDPEVTKLLTECDLPSTGSLAEKRKRLVMFFGARDDVDHKREKATDAGKETAGDEAARKQAGCL